MKRKYYVCIEDRQGGGFSVGRCLTKRQWLEQALEWCYMDEHFEYATTLRKMYKDKSITDIEFIGEIDSMWDITIVEVCKDNKKEVEEFIEWCDKYDPQDMISLKIKKAYKPYADKVLEKTK